jgi:TolB-like protein/Tfp pilus assembly protein PilF
MIGTTLGQFRVLEQIGAGGMGVVFKARDQSLDREVALKVLPPGTLDNEAARKRFRAEALALSRLNHPGICTIHQVGEAESGGAAGQTYIAMEYVEGKPLDQVIRDAPVPLVSVVRYGAQIADALAHAHERDITHRDMKSANVMITPEGRAKILDFGLAAPLVRGEVGSERTQLTEAGTMMGTPAYMPPEVIGGERADGRSDIWGLGVILYEMTTGSRPFTAAGPALTYEILKRQPELPESVPVALRSIILRCLTKERGERYQTAGEVGAALAAIESQLRTGGHLAPRRSTRAQVAWGAVGAASIGVVALFVFVLADTPVPFVQVAEAAPIQSLAVLPFTSFSGDPEQEYFVDGMTDALIGELAKLGTLNVIARTSVMAYKGPGKTIQQIASELGVDGIVEGSAVSSGGRVRLSARLIDASSNDNLWADEYERDLADILSLQREMARTIGGRIRAALTPEAEARLADSGPVDLDAYELTLRGRFATHQLSQEGLETAIDYFDRAIAGDPRYAPAYAGKAFAYANLSSIYVAPLVVMPLAKDAARRAIELDDRLSEAHTWLGYAHLFFDWDWAAAERELLTALDLNPSSGDAHLAYAALLVSQGRMDQALEHNEQAKRIDPLSILPYSSPNGSQWSLFIARRYDEAIVEGLRALEVDPENSWAHAYRGLALVATDRFEEGIDELEEATNLEDAPMLDALLAYGYAEAGRAVEARALLAEVEGVSRRVYTCAYEIAVTHVALGNDDAAFDWLNTALDDRADCIAFLNVDPRLDPIRDDPRFQVLLARSGFTAASEAVGA